ncbi:adenylate cyclase [Austwickia chelonae]|uniref:Putative adenylate cyclase n=1 Tax=Austwickia chelonae NBRC 105200 TaxID=1184607 RepID=K6VJ53_9MICO|nr:adenylate/guanylate cyclase domain-containing protein [Austwickia chelonae]GAB76764.1 putative adenylate cyclase [Austwickia chelonae NBRC 105200]SEW30357.1 adenylate cyclase [Austwickia chelonae]
MTTGSGAGSASTPREPSAAVPTPAPPGGDPGRPPRYARDDVCAAAGIPLPTARRFWHALGFPRVGDAEAVFTDADVDALTQIVGLIHRGVLDEERALGMTRAIGRSADRLTAWQTQLIREMAAPENPDRTCDTPAGPPCPGDPATTALAGELADELEPLLIYAWRRHLAATVSQLSTQADELRENDAMEMTVGFADMVGFTRVVHRLDERELGSLVQRFEAAASDTVAAYGGRLVKTVGDEILFCCTSPDAAAGIALTLIDVHAKQGDMPPLRAGLATGPVTARLGDLYGITVNRASRLTGLARPGTALADVQSGERLQEHRGIRLAALRARELRGFGPTRAYAIRPGREGPPRPDRSPVPHLRHTLPHPPRGGPS